MDLQHEVRSPGFRLGLFLIMVVLPTRRGSLDQGTEQFHPADSQHRLLSGADLDRFQRFHRPCLTAMFSAACSSRPIVLLPLPRRCRLVLSRKVTTPPNMTTSSSWQSGVGERGFSSPLALPLSFIQVPLLQLVCSHYMLKPHYDDHQASPSTQPVAHEAICRYISQIRSPSNWTREDLVKGLMHLQYL